MTDLDVELGVGHGLPLAQHARGDRAALLLGEEPVARDGDEQEARRDPTAHLVQRTVLRGRVVAVHRVRDLEIGVRVEAGEELARLVLEITLDGKRGAEARGVLLQPLPAALEPVLLLLAPEAAVEEVEGEIGDVRDLARLGEPHERAGAVVVIVATAPAGVERDRVAPHDVERERLRVERRARGDHHRLVHLARMRGDPLDHLDAAETAAHESREVRHADLAQERAVDLHRVADRESRKGRAVGTSSGGIDGGGTGRSLATAQHVRAHHAIAVRVNGLAGTDDGIPPAARRFLARTAAGHVRVARQRVADENDIVVRGRLAPARLPCDINPREHAAVLEAEAPGRQRQRRHMGFDDPDSLVLRGIHITSTRLRP